MNKTSVIDLKGRKRLDLGDRPELLLAMTTEEFM